MKKIIFIAITLIIAVYLLCLADDDRPPQKPEENKSLHSENWKVYESLVNIWPQLKKEGIESIRFCIPLGLEYGYDNESEVWKDDPYSFREEAANIVRWWPTIYIVPEENLPECIKIIDKTMKNAKGLNVRVWVSKRMLIVTKKGKYIVPVRIDPFYQVIVSGREWDSPELGEFIAKYCMPTYKTSCLVPTKEKTVAVLVFSKRKYESSHIFGPHDSRLSWPPIVLFGDKKEAEKLLGKSFEPKRVFEGREWLEKIITEYEIALKDAEKEHYRREDSSTLKGWIVFLTQDEFYWRGIGIDDDMVTGDYIKSKQLKEYFDELGITKELLAGEPNDIADKTHQN